MNSNRSQLLTSRRNFKSGGLGNNSSHSFILIYKENRKMKKEDFKFDFKALERMEDNGIYFGDLNERDYHSLALFFWACAPQYTLDEILGALIGGLLPVTVAELMEQLVNETKKALALTAKK